MNNRRLSNYDKLVIKVSVKDKHRLVKRFLKSQNSLVMLGVLDDRHKNSECKK